MPGIQAEVDAGFELSLGKADFDKIGSLFDKSDKKRCWYPYRRVVSGQCDANGNLTLPLIERLGAGKMYRITSLTQWCQGFTPASVYTAATAWFAYYQGAGISPANLIDLGPSTVGGTIFPNKKDYSKDADPILTGGQSFFFVLVGTAATANQTVTINIFGIMQDNNDGKLYY